MKEKRKKILFILILISFFALIPKLNQLEEEELKKNYIKDKKVGVNIIVARLIGIKKLTTNLIYVNEILELLDKEKSYEEIKKGLIIKSKEMTYLNPYFVSNYKFTGVNLGLIKVYRDINKAKEVVLRGLKYNKNKSLYSLYLGIVGLERKNIELLYTNLKIVSRGSGDKRLLRITAGLGEKLYQKKKKKKFIFESLYFWSKLLREEKKEKKKEIEDHMKVLLKEIKGVKE